MTKPVTPYIPEIPSGAADPGSEPVLPAGRARPRYLYRPYVAPEPTTARRRPAGVLSIGRVGIRARVDTVGLDRGTMAVPNDRRRLGRLATTAAADALLGGSVVSGHVSDRRDRPGALWRLRHVRVGDVVRWTAPDGEAHRFVVRRVARYPRSRGVPGHLFRTTGPHLLHLVTCTNRRGTPGGGFHYADNLVVTAEDVT